MSKQHGSNWSEGRFDRTRIVAIPPIEVDCSDWCGEIPDDAWKTGQFASDRQTLPPTDVELHRPSPKNEE